MWLPAILIPVFEYKNHRCHGPGLGVHLAGGGD